MSLDDLVTKFNDALALGLDAVTSMHSLMQLLAIGIIYLIAFLVAYKIRHTIGFTHSEPEEGAHTLRQLGYRLGDTIFPVLAIIFLKLTTELSNQYQFPAWLLNTALVIAVLLFFNSCIRAFVVHKILASLFRWIGLPLLFAHLIGILPAITNALSSVSLSVGNVEISAYGFLRVLIFGSFLFWLGRASNNIGKDIIRNQQSLDVSTKEVFSKVFEVAVFCIVFILILNVMGINLTALAVFGGALGVGLGLGLQTIASNFISGMIILLDRSLTIGDFVELNDGQKGFVREFKMRYTILETYDGKDVLVPNEKFISELMINWTHKDPKQRYRVDFSVPYATDIRSMVELIKEAVCEHPQVISGDDIPFEERPDCEIDSFGDSGVNMFVEFWMEGVDDGKNRVGGDLMLIIFETLRANGIEIPFPQREVRVLNEQIKVNK